MNTRLMCDLCGSQPCMCIETECLACQGEGEVEHRWLALPSSCIAESPPDPVMIKCEDCDGEGQIKCDGPREGGGCRFRSGPNVCHCERKWEQQQEDWASEPPPSARERQEKEYLDRQALRSGIPQ